MNSNEKIIANAVSGKTARPCDCCIKKRARWYCPSDDAFLCQGCDGSVHSANPLARRHERVLLKTAASLKFVDTTNHLPTWHRGSTRKIRTPRHAKHSLSRKVPELGCETEDPTSSTSSHYNDCEMEDRVPTFDPFIPELYPASDLGDFEEFAADVETLLGKGLDGELCGIHELGFLDNDEEMKVGELIKAESEDVALREPFDLSFIYDDNEVEGEDEKESKEMVGREKMTSLRLDYDAISKAWASQGSPWISGQRPHINPHDYSWPHCLMGGVGAEARQEYYGKWHGGHGAGMGDGEREARVLRYREKRRTRLFSKKIRYEVRKLNAEKRPRMKGRFVKRSSSNNSFPLLSK